MFIEELTHPNLDCIPESRPEQEKVISWYEKRDTLVTGTWQEYEERVKSKIAAHVAQTALMRGNITAQTKE